MDRTDVEAWFASYLDRFAAVGRGEAEPEALLADYGVPLLLTSDAGGQWLTDEAALLALVRGQAEVARAGGYDHSEVLALEVDVLNEGSALVRGAFVRRRADGSELLRLAATYLMADGPAGRRIAAIALQAA